MFVNNTIFDKKRPARWFPIDMLHVRFTLAEKYLGVGGGRIFACRGHGMHWFCGVALRWSYRRRKD
jgi:hypothetical protein